MTCHSTQRALVIGEALIDIVERDGAGPRRARRRQPAQRRGRTRAAGPRRRLPDPHRRRRTRPPHRRLRQASGVQLVSGSMTAASHPDGAGDAGRQRRGAVRLRHRLAAGRHAGGGPAAGRAHRLDRDGARTRVPGDRRAARRVSSVGHDHVRPERATGADRRSTSRRAAASTGSSRRCDVVKASDEDMRWIDPNRTPEQIATDMAGAWVRRSSR